MLKQNFSFSILSDLKKHQLVIDLTDNDVILDFAHCIRSLPAIRRQTIWLQNVRINDIIQSETKSHRHIDDILLFLIIIYGREKYPSAEDDALISKLKQLVVSQPFIDIKKHLNQKYFPLSQDEFISNNDYFACMIEEYCSGDIPLLTRARTLPQNLHKQSDIIDDLKLTHSSPATVNIEDVLYDKIEEKVMDLFANKFKELDRKMENVTNEISLMKYALSEDAKSEIRAKDGLLDQIKGIKRDISKLQNMEERIRKRSVNNEELTENLGDIMECKEEETVEYAKSEKINELKQWMESECELPQYIDVFVANGIDDLEIVQHITITDLALLGVGTLVDRVKIMQTIQKLKYERHSLTLKTESETKSL